MTQDPWPLRAVVAPEPHHETINEVRLWCEDHLGPRSQRWELYIKGTGMRSLLTGRHEELVIYTREPEDHALVSLTWC